MFLKAGLENYASHVIFFNISISEYANTISELILYLQYYPHLVLIALLNMF